MLHFNRHTGDPLRDPAESAFPRYDTRGAFKKEQGKKRAKAPLTDEGKEWEKKI